MKTGFLRPILAVAVFALALAPAAQADQPHMEKALNALLSARAELNQAIADKGGHRVNALNLVNQAIEEVNKGIKAGR